MPEAMALVSLCIGANWPEPLLLTDVISTRNLAHLGSTVVECWTRDRVAVGSSLTGVIYPCLVLVQPRKTRTDMITEKLLTGT